MTRRNISLTTRSTTNKPSCITRYRRPVMELLHHAASLYHSITHIHHTLTDAHDEMTTSGSARATETVEFLRAKLPAHLAKPRVAIVCGSGLGGLSKTVNEGSKEEWDYANVPNLPISTGKMWRTPSWRRSFWEDPVRPNNENSQSKVMKASLCSELWDLLKYPSSYS